MIDTLLKECNGKIKIFALTGIRSEYDLLYPVLFALQQDPAFELGVIVSGAHLTALHDYSIKIIEKDGFRVIEKIENLLFSNTTLGKVKSSGLLLMGIGQTLEREKPDLLIVIGDREEPLIGAIAASYLGIPVIHLAGGDNTNPMGGDVDEGIRHATTKLANLHLTFAKAHSERIQKMGEEPWRVVTVGNPGLDRLASEQHLSKKDLELRLGDGVNRDYAILLYHPLSSGIESAAKEIEICMNSILENKIDVFVGAPNSDPGFEDVQNVINRFKSNPRVHIYTNLPRDIFITLLYGAKCLLGNSSMGILEAPFIGLPCVNIGERQKGRLSAKNVQFVAADPNEVRSALHRALFDQNYIASVKLSNHIYGDGKTAQRIIDVIKQLPSKSCLLSKQMTY